MSTINPPVPLQNPEDQYRVDYIQDTASNPDFEYPTVSINIINPQPFACTLMFLIDDGRR